MNLDEIEFNLRQMISDNGDPGSTTSQFCLHILQSLLVAKQGNVSNEELVEIMKDVQRQLNILDDANNLNLKIQLNTIINGIITIASAV